MTACLACARNFPRNPRSLGDIAIIEPYGGMSGPGKEKKVGGKKKKKKHGKTFSVRILSSIPQNELGSYIERA